MKTPLRTCRRSRGFTLIEFLIATSVSGVLASVAYPSLSGALHKMRRTEALVATIQLQQAEERWRSANSRYGSLAEIGVAAIASGRNYLLSVVGASATGYTAVAQATGTQASDRQCRYMLLSVESGNLSDNSGETAAGSIDAQENRRRWNQ